MFFRACPHGHHEAAEVGGRMSSIMLTDARPNGPIADGQFSSRVCSLGGQSALIRPAEYAE